jgi:hypothetical protein
MPLINATWKVTHAGVVLLDWTDFSDGEPRIERAFVSDRVAVLHGDAVTYLGRKNVSHTASFSRVVFFENDDEARTYEREHTVALSDEPNDCLIEWLNTGASDTLVNAVLTGYRARVENNFFMADYTLQGGAWLTTGFAPPPPPVTTTGYWRLVTVTGPPAGVTLQVKNDSDVWEDVWTYIASS